MNPIIPAMLVLFVSGMVASMLLPRGVTLLAFLMACWTGMRDRPDLAWRWSILWAGCVAGLLLRGMASGRGDGYAGGGPECGRRDTGRHYHPLPYGIMDRQGIRIRPFIKDSGPMTGMTARYLDRSWRRMPDDGGFDEPCDRFTDGSGTVWLIVGRATGLGALVTRMDTPEPPHVVDMLRSKHMPRPEHVFLTDTVEGDTGLIRACMLWQASTTLIDGAAHVACSSHPHAAALSYRNRCRRLRRALDTFEYNPSIGEHGWADHIRQGMKAYDDTMRRYAGLGLMRAVTRMAARIKGLAQ